MVDESRFIVGIDLGTTNIAAAYVDTENASGTQQLEILQLVNAGEVAALKLLPSFCYLPGTHELPPGALELPWSKKASYAVGTFARQQGAAVPGRLVSSAKSWLAHGGVDRTSAILPWGGDAEEEIRISPVAASRYFLEHVRRAWDNRFGAAKDRNGTTCVLSEQQVILTVPASFDEVARELTVQAAREAGLENIVLLEEPLAAFYAWLSEHSDDWKARLSEGDSILIVDIGGGTTDFSLVEIEQNHTLRRTHVGEHLLLGGDNVDMALARAAEAQWGTRLPAREWSLLVQRCREAKERLLSERGLGEVKIAVHAAGSAVVAGTRSTTLTREQVTDVLLHGFFPVVDRRSPAPARRTGIREMGLPYAVDPAVTRHLLAFLRKAAGAATHDADAPLIRPDHILFNGGALHPELVRRRTADLVNQLSESADGLNELVSTDLDLAVSRGAAYYGLVRRGMGVRVQGGIARSYYLEVAVSGSNELICVMPRDTQEGRVIELTDHRFRAKSNQPVRFPLFSSATRLGDEAGQVLQDREALTEMPPLHTFLRYGKGKQRDLEVEVSAVLNEVGTLDIWCETTDAQHRYPLSFDLRSQAPSDSAGPDLLLPAHRVEAARDVLRRGFADVNQLPQLTNQLEKRLGVKRDKWGAAVLRSLADVSISQADLRLRTPKHEARWLNLTGFCLRPGFGAPADDWRIKEMWKLWHGGPHANQTQVLTEWWICWRRISGGLRAGHQQQIANILLRDLVPRKGSALGPRKAPAQVAAEMWRCLGALERLSAGTKLEVFEAMLQSERKLQGHHFWVIARVGARRLMYGPADTVIPAFKVEPLIPELFERVESMGRSRPALLALASVCRLCGIRDLDLNEEIRGRAADKLKAENATPQWQNQLFEVQAETSDYREEVLGDTLPLGLSLEPDSV